MCFHQELNLKEKSRRISEDLSPKLTAALELQAVRSCHLFVRELLGFMGEDVQDARAQCISFQNVLSLHLVIMS